MNKIKVIFETKESDLDIVKSALEYGLEKANNEYPIKIESIEEIN